MRDKLKNWLTWPLFRVFPNPSGQDQLSDHTWPCMAFTFLFLTFPYGQWIALVVPAIQLYIELIEDGHWKDIWKKNDGSPTGSADGRCDLFFRLAGSGIAYLSLLWK